MEYDCEAFKKEREGLRPKGEKVREGVSECRKGIDAAAQNSLDFLPLSSRGWKQRKAVKMMMEQAVWTRKSGGGRLLRAWA